VADLGAFAGLKSFGTHMTRIVVLCEIYDILVFRVVLKTTRARWAWVAGGVTEVAGGSKTSFLGVQHVACHPVHVTKTNHSATLALDRATISLPVLAVDALDTTVIIRSLLVLSSFTPGAVRSTGLQPNKILKTRLRQANRIAYIL
jgi:hypothetical protein